MTTIKKTEHFKDTLNIFQHAKNRLMENIKK